MKIWKLFRTASKTRTKFPFFLKQARTYLLSLRLQTTGNDESVITVNESTDSSPILEKQSSSGGSSSGGSSSSSSKPTATSARDAKEKREDKMFIVLIVIPLVNELRLTVALFYVSELQFFQPRKSRVKKDETKSSIEKDVESAGDYILFLFRYS